MASPLLEFANARLRILTSTAVERTSDGRFYTNDDAYYLVVCYMKRTQYTGVTSGSRKVPLASELNGEMLPGASGDEFYYRGYSLQKASILGTYDWKKQDISDLNLIDIVDQEDFLRPQTEVEFLFGDQVMKGTIQRSTGLFGGTGIDQIIYPAIGVELQITGGEVLN
jgi:hypothetical protein